MIPRNTVNGNASTTVPTVVVVVVDVLTLIHRHDAMQSVVTGQTGSNTSGVEEIPRKQYNMQK